jgi:hypothetical protein
VEAALVVVILDWRADFAAPRLKRPKVTGGQMDAGAPNRAAKYHLGECGEFLLSLPVSLCLKKNCAKLAASFHPQNY